MNNFNLGVVYYSYIIGAIAFISGIFLEGMIYPSSTLFSEQDFVWLIACVIFSTFLSSILATQNTRVINYIFIIASVGILVFAFINISSPDGGGLFMAINSFAVVIPLYVATFIGIKILTIFQTTQNEFIKILIFIVPLLLAPIAGYFFAS